MGKKCCRIYWVSCFMVSGCRVLGLAGVLLCRVRTKDDDVGVVLKLSIVGFV